tara:strand:+ start:615 stop:1691 length:1077 start_codon:yes stop_codon:yes gene_type:complete
MKQSKYRKKVDTLFILGAGSSRALTHVNPRKNEHNRSTTPVDSDFLTLMNYFSSKAGWQKKGVDLIASNWLEKSNFWDGGLESSIIKRVADYNMLSSLYKEKARKKVSNAEYLNSLSHLITDYLLKCRSNKSGETKKFVDFVFPEKTPYSELNNRIITFNYDLIIDRVFFERGWSKQKIYFDRIAKKEIGGTRRNTIDAFPDPLLVKLHGSLNWRCSQKNFESIIDGTCHSTDKITIWTDDTQSAKPDDGHSPLIIPPIPNKPITASPIFSHLWTKAFEYLHEAKKIVIVGYSCPATDVMAQSIFTQFRNMNTTDIYVVDPSADAMANYVELMHGQVKKNVRWHYYRGFSEYLENEVS